MQTIGYVAGAAIAQNTDLAGADPKERLAVPEALDRADSLGTARRRAEAYAVLAPIQERGAMFRSIRASAAATMPARARLYHILLEIDPNDGRAWARAGRGRSARARTQFQHLALPSPP